MESSRSAYITLNLGMAIIFNAPSNSFQELDFVIWYHWSIEEMFSKAFELKAKNPFLFLMTGPKALHNTFFFTPILMPILVFDFSLILFFSKSIQFPSSIY